MPRWLSAAAVIAVGALLTFALSTRTSRSELPLSASPGPALSSPPPSPVPPASPSPVLRVRSGVPVFTHIFLIVMENREYGSVIGNPVAPYLNGLAARYGLATAYYGITHPSLPNYLALSAGSTFGISDNCTDCFVNSRHIADQVEASGRSWKAYMEDMPAPCFLGNSSAGYAQKHDPFVYFLDVRNNSRRCAAHVVPLSQFGADIAAGSVPDFSWITPNLCHDMHDCSTAAGDAWLGRIVPTILAAPSWREGGVLFITWDEGETAAGCCGNAAGGQVATLVISPGVIPGFRATRAQTHYSLLRTIEDSWGLPPLGEAATAAAMREFFPG